MSKLDIYSLEEIRDAIEHLFLGNQTGSLKSAELAKYIAEFLASYHLHIVYKEAPAQTAAGTHSQLIAPSPPLPIMEHNLAIPAPAHPAPPQEKRCSTCKHNNEGNAYGSACYTCLANDNWEAV